MQSALIPFLILTLANDGDAATLPGDAQLAADDAQVTVEARVDRRWLRPPRAGGRLLASAGEVRARLGSRRARELREANFHFRRCDLDPSRDLADDPVLQERVEDIVFDSFVKLVRTSLERAIDLDRRAEDLRSRIEASGFAPSESSGRRRGFELSPNVWISSDLAVGFRVRPRTAHPFWSRTRFEVRQYTDSEALQMRLKYARGDQLFMIEHRKGDRIRGDSFGLLLRTTF